jgi:dephospho-CoA kinase
MPDSTPRILGITGNIACGKSLVSSMLSDLGADVIDADLVAHELMQAGSPVLSRISSHFGEDVLNEDGSLNRPALGQIVFGDPDQLATLEAITHPPTVEEIVRRAKSSESSISVIDAIKLYEAGLAEHCDQTWAVICDDDVQKQRLMDRNGFSDEEAQKRIDSQPPQGDKKRRADVVIDNSGTVEKTRQQVASAWSAFIAG